SMGLDPKTLRLVFDTIKSMNSAGRTVLLVEQNARQALRMSHFAVVLENGLLRLSGSGRGGLNTPGAGALFPGGKNKNTPKGGAPGPGQFWGGGGGEARV